MTRDKKAKDAFIIIRVTREFKDAIELVASSQGKKLSEFVRTVLATKM